MRPVSLSTTPYPSPPPLGKALITTGRTHSLIKECVRPIHPMLCHPILGLYYVYRPHTRLLNTVYGVATITSLSHVPSSSFPTLHHNAQSRARPIHINMFGLILGPNSFQTLIRVLPHPCHNLMTLSSDFFIKSEPQPYDLVIRFLFHSYCSGITLLLWAGFDW